ncbi:tetratricopeptide repeat-containing protein [Sphingobacterium sp. CZ-2]|uniref:tetratricopeptide repeat-containing protein n=1 Tax=Sphingobacterium sp. CZ-2 TaxID=2557994 RepID=UPI00106F9E81|nr:tetratricopeptide repeat-containing protein [Sphingobacterium sp. CZ-2]QBR13452.1 hypothetical protein E3D81_15225 [Sphingobacterium sp. CZ-2]
MDLRQVFRKALENPLEVSEVDFQQLLSKYPFSQPIIFAQERKKNLENLPVDKQKTLMYAYNSFWLRDYLQKPVAQIPELEAVSDDYIAFEEYTSEDEQEEVVLEEEVLGEGFLEEEVLDKEVEAEVEENFFDPPAAYNIESAFPEVDEEEDVPLDEDEEDVEVAVEKLEGTHREEDVSLYNDELMPYSFRWWLYKTRLEHAETYQPFVSPVLPKSQKGQFDPKKLDEAILDQQIRENIFHLQNPEDKLSEPYKKETIEFRSNESTDEVIEKFIREEPQIQPPRAESINTENKARRSSEDQLSVVTETLANIYESQGMYEKAISVFRKLISENPEKKSYFAARIKELEQKL